MLQDGHVVVYLSDESKVISSLDIQEGEEERDKEDRERKGGRGWCEGVEEEEEQGGG